MCYIFCVKYIYILYVGAIRSLVLPLLSNYRINFADDLAFLLEGVSGFRLKKECSEIQVHGLLAFPIFPFLVGAYYGRGRVLCVTHEELFGQQVGLKFKMLSHDFKREKVAKDQCTKLINLVDLYLICVSGPLFTLFSRKSRFSFKYNEIVKVKYDTDIYTVYIEIFSK